MRRAPSSRETTVRHSANGSGSSSNGTVLVNLDVFIQRATIGRDISPADEDLIVLFRRNSKEITSEPTRWHSDHVAVWNQHVAIQTSLLRNKAKEGEYLKKEYEVVLVALPSHSAVALFTVDFADLLHTTTPIRQKTYRISPVKCRDLAATLEFEIVWDYVTPPMSSPPTTSSSIPNSIMLMKQQQQQQQLLQQRLGSGGGYNNMETASNVSSRRTTASMCSQDSERDFMDDFSHGSCSSCRSSKRKLERKEMQILQLESFLKESQKRIDSLVFETEELLVREQAETENAATYRAMALRLLQELEMAFQFCAQQVLQSEQNAGDDANSSLFMFLPQFEFMERVKQFHYELDLVTGNTEGTAEPRKLKKNPQDLVENFDFRTEIEAAMQRNQHLQRQIEFLNRSMGFDNPETSGLASNMAQSMDGLYPISNANVNTQNSAFTTGAPRLHRTGTNASESTNASDNSLNDSMAQSRVAPVLTMTEQLNNLERENFLLKAKLESALVDLKHYHASQQMSSEASETTSSSSRGTTSDDPTGGIIRTELDQIREDRIHLEQHKSALEQELEAARDEIKTLKRELDESTATSLAVGTKSTGAAPEWLNGSFVEMGKSKNALEEKVKQLTLLVRQGVEENAKLRAEMEIQKAVTVNELDSESLESDEPKIVRLDDDAGDSTQLIKEEKAMKQVEELKEQLTNLQEIVSARDNQLIVKEQELVQTKEQVMKSEEKAQTLEIAKKVLEQEMLNAAENLKKAHEQTAQLEKQVTNLQQQLESMEQASNANASFTAASAPSTSLSFSSLSSSFVAPNASTENRDEELAELTKQLKLSKQEVMQLRYRSNQLESVNEKLEEALKEKRTLQVKLTALEGQLYEQRNRTINDSFSANMANEPKDSMMVAELQRQLDQKSAQLLISQREAEMMRRELTAGSAGDGAATGGSSGSTHDIDELNVKVKKFEGNIAQLIAQNEDQAKRIDALGTRIANTIKERNELEQLLKEMVQEMDAVEQLYGNQHTPNQNQRPEEEEKAPAPTPESFAPIQVDILGPPPARSNSTASTGGTGSVLDRYANVLNANNNVSNDIGKPAQHPVQARRSSGAGIVTKSKVAHLIKNFSSDGDASNTDTGDDEPLNSPSAKIKKPMKMDFRLRNTSSASARSSRTNSSSSGTVDTMVNRFKRMGSTASSTNSNVF